ncbi:MAG: TlpA disulfide reductase family protein, partial [Planctomycetota bacterium]|nr:TlpA disulfide reductase family protein [Planctomycetota bacterium]
ASLLSMGSLPDMMLQGFQKTPHGPRLLLGAQDGQSVVTLDGDTGLIRRIDTAIKPASMPIEVNLELVIDSKVMDELPADQAIAFDPAGKTKVDGINDLLPAAPGTPKGLAVGDPAPTFDLESLDGSKVSLASLKGSVVVLDFWATWCGPCRAGMPAMAELAEWAASEGGAIKVFAVNVGETRQKAASYWEREKFGFPTLLDPTSAAAMAYGASSIPLTVVIDPEGRVAKVEVGLTFDPRSEASRKAHLAKMQESLGKLLPKGG